MALAPVETTMEENFNCWVFNTSFLPGASVVRRLKQQERLSLPLPRVASGALGDSWQPDMTPIENKDSALGLDTTSGRLYSKGGGLVQTKGGWEGLGRR